MTEAAAKLLVAPAPEKVARSRPKFIAADTTPAGALRWRNSIERGQRADAWRRAVSSIFPADGRVLRISWLLQRLVAGGYCFATDAYIAAETGVPINKVSEALATLERADAIIRRHVLNGRKKQRRIWLSALVMNDPNVPPTVGDTDTPRVGTNAPPSVGGQNRKYNKARENRVPDTMSTARLDAERRARWERERFSLVEDEAGAPTGARQAHRIGAADDG